MENQRPNDAGGVGVFADDGATDVVDVVARRGTGCGAEDERARVEDVGDDEVDGGVDARAPRAGGPPHKTRGTGGGETWERWETW